MAKATKYKIIKIQEYNSFGNPNQVFYNIKEQKSFLGITYWKYCYRHVETYGGGYLTKVLFYTLKEAEDYISTEKRKKYVKPTKEIILHD